MKVLIAVEDSVFGDALRDFVAKHKFAESSKFKVVHVVEPVMTGLHPGVSSSQIDSINEERQRLGRNVVSRLSAAIRQLYPGSAIDEVVTKGSPRESILHLANDWKADMIIMGSHGKGALERFLIGSVSLAVLSQAPCSVVIVRLPGEIEEESQKPEAKPEKVEAKN